MCTTSHISRKNPTIFTCRNDTGRVFFVLLNIPDAIYVEVLEVLTSRYFLILTECLDDLSLSDVPNAYDSV